MLKPSLTLTPEISPQTLLQELGPGDGAVMAFDSVLQKLLEDYGSDDTRNVKETTEYLKASWASLRQR